MMRGKRSVKRKRRENSDRKRIIAGYSVPCPPPSYSKEKKRKTHAERLFAGYVSMGGDEVDHLLLKISIVFT